MPKPIPRREVTYADMRSGCVCAWFDGCPVHDIVKCPECGEQMWREKPHTHAGFLPHAGKEKAL